MTERGWLKRFIKFCVVGGSGVAVDMTVLHMLNKWLGWNVSLSKFCSAEIAMFRNFFWNEFWTFGGSINIAVKKHSGWVLRLIKFNAICSFGIGMAILLLHVFYSDLGIELYVANLLAITLVTLWNFWMNLKFNWKV
mgnify:FL=1